MRTDALGPLRRVTVGLLLGGCALVAVVRQAQYRNAEALLESQVLRHLLHMAATVTPGQAYVWAGVRRSLHGFLITPECSTALIVAIVAAIAAPLSVMHRRPMRVLVGASVAAVVLLTANVLRLSLVIWATQRWGASGFTATHVYVGSVLMLMATMVAIVAFLMVLGVGPRKSPGQRGDA